MPAPSEIVTLKETTGGGPDLGFAAPSGDPLAGFIDSGPIAVGPTEDADGGDDLLHATALATMKRPIAHIFHRISPPLRTGVRDRLDGRHGKGRSRPGGPASLRPERRAQDRRRSIRQPRAAPAASAIHRASSSSARRCRVRASRGIEGSAQQWVAREALDVGTESPIVPLHPLGDCGEAPARDRRAQHGDRDERPERDNGPCRPRPGGRRHVDARHQQEQQRDRTDAAVEAVPGDAPRTSSAARARPSAVTPARSMPRAMNRPNAPTM